REPGRRTFCHPDVYKGTGVRLYKNLGNGKFADRTGPAQLESTEGKCLGLVLADFNGDSWPDMFVANDGVQNFLYVNRGDGTFGEEGLASGVGFSDDGQPEAGMGADSADANGDLLPDIYVSHLDNELNRLYRNQGDGRFKDATVETGLGTERSLFSGFGLKFADFDNSGRQHIVVANGHILDNITLFHPLVRYREPTLLLEQSGCCSYRNSSALAGPVFQKPLLGRGLATGDLDSDGLIDFVISQNFGSPVVVRNRSAGGNWLTLTLRGAGESNRDAVGAEVTIVSGGKKQRAQVTGASSYCSASDRKLHFGTGAATRVDRLDVKWPSGKVETLSHVTLNRTLTLTEGQVASLQIVH
ncbi:MAG: CRTAC1 family protein, partial [Bryobacteraceae bacterium]|nr:CRTAC1 family protein [Bryobacteraceae bacterium]